MNYDKRSTYNKVKYLVFVIQSLELLGLVAYK